MTDRLDPIMDRICANCGLTYGSHKGETPDEDECRDHEGRMDWPKTGVTTFVDSGRVETVPTGTPRVRGGTVVSAETRNHHEQRSSMSTPIKNPHDLTVEDICLVLQEGRWSRNKAAWVRNLIHWAREEALTQGYEEGVFAGREDTRVPSEHNAAADPEPPAKPPLSREAWLVCEALRSGRFTQSEQVAHMCENGSLAHMCENGSHTPLGVICEVAIEDGVPVERRQQHDAIVAFDGFRFGLPERVRRWIGFTSDVGSSSAGTRIDYLDRDFNGVADWIESQPEGLFAARADGDSDE